MSDWLSARVGDPNFDPSAIVAEQDRVRGIEPRRHGWSILECFSAVDDHDISVRCPGWIFRCIVISRHVLLGDIGLANIDAVFNDERGWKEDTVGRRAQGNGRGLLGGEAKRLLESTQ